MGVDAKDIQCFLWKIVLFSINICYKFAQKHPFVSGVVLLFFLFYLFLPSVYFFLIYSSPVIVCITVFVRIHLKRNHSEIQNDKKVDGKSSVESKSFSADAVVSGNDDKPAVHSQMSRRTKIKEWNAECGNKDKRVIFATTSVDASIVGNQKGIAEENGSSLDHAQTSNRTRSDAVNIRAKDDFVGKIGPREEKSKVVVEKKGSASLDSGESSGLITSAPQIVGEHEDLAGKTSLNKGSLIGVAQNKENHYSVRGESFSGNRSTTENIPAPDQSNSVLYSEPSMVDLILQNDDCVDPSEKAIGGGGRGEDEKEESSDEEETQQHGNNAVEWTADDQQNLMDLGDSELERNKRLESLIARRRARKLFKMANEKKGMESASGPAGQIPPIAISRNNILNIPNNLDMIEDLQLPGSAPSILLPTRNPFDIPYDRNEERPNLMHDSFNEEFSAVDPKELFFCRHESFFFGPSFSMESQQDQNNSHFGLYDFDTRTARGVRFSRYRTTSDMSAHDQLIDDLLSSHEGEDLSHNMSATELVELGSHSPKQSTKSEESKHVISGMKGEGIENIADRGELRIEIDNSSEPFSEPSFHANIPSSTVHFEPRGGKFRQDPSDRVKNSLTFTIPEGITLNGPAYDSSPFARYKPRMEERLLYRDKGPCHSPGYSIASDLQVEGSELGSPPLPIDGIMSPTDAESSYDGDIEKDITAGRDELWGASSHLSGVEENESRSREVNEVSEDDILEVGFSGIKKNLQNPITSSTLPAQIAEQDKSNTSLLSFPRTEMPEKDQIHSKNPDNKTSQNIKQVAEETHKSSNFSDALPPKILEKALPVMESASLPPTEVYSKKPEELSNAQEKSAEVNAVSKVDDHDQIVDANNDKDNLKSTEEKGGGSQIPTNKEALMDLSQPAEKITSESLEDIEKNCDKHADTQTVIESEKQVEENRNPEFFEGDPPKLNEHEEIGDMSMLYEVQDEQNTTEVRVSGVNQSFDNPVISVPPQIFMAEQLSTNSSSCSSPRSVVPGKIQTGQIPPLHFRQQIPNEVSLSIPNDTVRNYPLVEVSPENVILVTEPESSQRLVEDPVDRPSTKCNFGQSKETANSEIIDEHQGKLTENKAIAGPSNSFDGEESSSVVKDNKDIIHLPKLANSEAKLGACENCQGESKTVVEKEAANRPPVPAAENAVEKEPQKFTAKDGSMHNVNETVPDVNQENAADQLKPDTDKREPNDLKKDNVKMDNLTNNNAVEQSKPTESENETKNEINTAA